MSRPRASFTRAFIRYTIDSPLRDSRDITHTHSPLLVVVPAGKWMPIWPAITIVTLLVISVIDSTAVLLAASRCCWQIRASPANASIVIVSTLPPGPSSITASEWKDASFILSAISTRMKKQNSSSTVFTCWNWSLYSSGPWSNWSIHLTGTLSKV